MKKDVELNEETTKAYTLLIELVKKLNWGFAIPSGGGPEDDGNLHGMIIGESAYINYILKHTSCYYFPHVYFHKFYIFVHSR